MLGDMLEVILALVLGSGVVRLYFTQFYVMVDAILHDYTIARYFQRYFPLFYAILMLLMIVLNSLLFLTLESGGS